MQQLSLVAFGAICYEWSGRRLPRQLRISGHKYGSCEKGLLVKCIELYILDCVLWIVLLLLCFLLMIVLSNTFLFFNKTRLLATLHLLLCFKTVTNSLCVVVF